MESWPPTHRSSQFYKPYFNPYPERLPSILINFLHWQDRTCFNHHPCGKPINLTPPIYPCGVLGTIPSFLRHFPAIPGDLWIIPLRFVALRYLILPQLSGSLTEDMIKYFLHIQRAEASSHTLGLLPVSTPILRTRTVRTDERRC